ncbi:MAG: hypothetical protein ACYTAF_07360 [Planctomycetota bacterium]|jgi:hypothetical protein
MRGRCGKGLAAVVVIVLILSAVAAIGVVAYMRVQLNEKIDACRNNLHRLWQAMHTYADKYGGHTKRMPEATGTDFWLTLRETRPPIIRKSKRKLLYCPVKGFVGGTPTTYRGPTGDVNLCGDNMPVGSDFVDNHSSDGSEGGHVLIFSGTIKKVGPGNTLWTSTKLKGGPEP